MSLFKTFNKLKRYVMYKETAYKTLEKISEIADDNERKEALRTACLQDNNLAIVIQRTYHPNYSFDLPYGPISETARKSNHDEAGVFYQSLRRWYVFRQSNQTEEQIELKPHIREQQFIDLYESVASDDADLLVAVKDKKLPWDSLDVNFVVDAIPELFPDSFRPGDQVKVNQKSDDKNKAVARPETTKKDQCLWIMQNNLGLTRKEYIELFEKIGVSKTTGSLYYQSLKSKV